MEVVIDTNVPVVANGRAVQAGTQCRGRCIDELMATRARRRLLLDDQGQIIEVYRRHLSPAGQPDPGDAFFKWLWDNQANPAHVRIVSVTPLDDDPRGFAEVPADVDLATFDWDDRKFVAVALASGSAPSILNASDRDWWIHRRALKRCGVRVEFLCPELMNNRE